MMNKEVIVEQIDKSAFRAETEVDLQWLSYPVDGMLPMMLEMYDTHIVAHYEIGNKCYFNEIYTWSYEHQLKVLIDIKNLSSLTHRYAFSLDPENIMIDEVEHCYIIRRDILPAESSGESRFVAEYKALTMSVLDQDFSFRDYMADFTRHLSEKKPLMARIADSSNAEEIGEHLLVEYRQYMMQQKTNYIHIKKRQFYALKRYVIVSLGILTFLTCITGYQCLKKIPELLAGKNLGEYYLIQDYEKCTEEMKNISVSGMSPAQSYMLANAYIRMENLSDEQRENILNTLNIKDSDLRAKYWIYIGRHESMQALDTARRLNDPELEMYSYLQMAKEISSNTKLSGQEKYEQSESVQAEIERIEKKLENQEHE